MFGFGKKDTAKRVGAHEKVATAKQFTNQYQIKSKREGKQSAAIPVVILYGLAVVAAFVLGEFGGWQDGINLHLGNPTADKLLFGPGNGNVTGDPSMDAALTIFVRGTVIFLLAGAVPVLAMMWQRLLDNSHMNMYVATAGVLIVFGTGLHLGWDYVYPVLQSLADLFF